MREFMKESDWQPKFDLAQKPCAKALVVPKEANRNLPKRDGGWEAEEDEEEEEKEEKAE